MEPKPYFRLMRCYLIKISVNALFRPNFVYIVSEFFFIGREDLKRPMSFFISLAADLPLERMEYGSVLYAFLYFMAYDLS